MHNFTASQQATKALLGLLFCWLLCLPLRAQEGKTITGRVTGENEEVLPGVNVSVKGTTTGTITDAQGQYSLTVPQAGSVLVFSFVGYTTEEVPVSNRTTLDISLVPDIKALGEVVVVGYGTQRKAETTGAISSVKAAELTQTPVVNVAQGLQARAAGVQITQNNAAPGGNISVRIRGTNSINGTSEPLYVVDGIQITNSGGVNDVSPLSTINPNDIESVEVLKDASATAIYGARAANGVVLITTKRGKAGATRVTYDGYYGVQQASRKIDMLNATQFAELENEVYKTQVYPDPASLGEGIDWQDLVLRDAPIQNHQLTVAGGSEKTQLALSANYFNQDGIIISSAFKRYSLRVNLDHQIGNRVKVGTSIFGSYSINSRIPTGQTSFDAPAVTGSIVGAAIAAPPTLAPYDENGRILPFGDQYNGRYREVVNPLGLAEILNRTSIRRTLVNIYADVNILEGLTYRASFNVDLDNQLRDVYSPRSIIASGDLNANVSGTAEKYNSNGTNLLHESILTYAKRFADIHSFKFTGVFATQGIFFNRNEINVTGFPNDVTRNEAVQLGTNRNVESLRREERLDSYMGRINYGFRDKYFLDLTARLDGASKFGQNNKYGFFPAASAAWRIIQEPFMQNLSFVSDLKLRASFGLTGNAGAIDPYQSLALVGASSGYTLNGVFATGISPSRIPNPDLGWERSVQGDIGLDVGLFGDRLSVVVDVYTKRTNDLLFVKSLPLSSGYENITGNFASILNRGIEFSADARILTGDLKWSVNGNFSVNRNELLSLPNDQQELIPDGAFTYSILQVGQPIGIFRTYIFDGIYQTDEPILPGSGSRTGGVKVRDVNNDGQITTEDQVITGNANPDFIFGFSTNLSYKGFDLAAFVTGVQGNEVFNQTRYLFENPLGARNVLAGMANRWSPTNPNNEFVSGFQGGRLPISDRFMEDGSFVRLRNITLGYTLPQIKGVSRARVYVSGNNLVTLTRYSGYDPEVNTFGGNNVRVGIDNGVYPLAKSFLGGIQVTF